MTKAETCKQHTTGFNLAEMYYHIIILTMYFGYTNSMLISRVGNAKSWNLRLLYTRFESSKESLHHIYILRMYCVHIN